MGQPLGVLKAGLRASWGAVPRKSACAGAPEAQLARAAIEPSGDLGAIRVVDLPFFRVTEGR